MQTQSVFKNNNFSIEICFQKISTIKFLSPHIAADPSEVFLKRELLCHSLEGRRVDLLTVADCSNADTNSQSGSPRKVVFVSARVHPGEMPGQFVFFGFLTFLLSSDPRAHLLRQQFLFKLVPIINPDGVARGHYRANSKGQNLNRFYNLPQTEHEAIGSIKLLLEGFAHQDRLLFYLDLHGHANKRGCFLFGNYLPPGSLENAWSVGFCRVLAMNSPHIDLQNCDFSKKNMARVDKRDERGTSKEGSGRVGIFTATGLVCCYTLECHYACGKQV